MQSEGRERQVAEAEQRAGGVAPGRAQLQDLQEQQRYCC